MKFFFPTRIRLPFFGLVLLLVLAACGPDVSALKEKRDVQGLISILGDTKKSLSVRTDAANALGEIADPLAVDPLIAYMQECAATLNKTGLPRGMWDDAKRACGNVSQTLGQMGDSRAVDPLINLLDNLHVRKNVWQALGKLGDPRAIVPLINGMYASFFATEKEGDRYAELRPIVIGLAEKSGSQAFEPLRDALPSFYVKGEDGYCYKYSLGISALLMTKDPRLEQVLLSELETYQGCKYLLPNALAEFYKDDVAKLIPLFEAHTDFFYKILIGVKNPEADHALIAALDKSNSLEMAKDFHSSGNPALEAAAHQWGEKWGYQFID